MKRIIVALALQVAFTLCAQSQDISTSKLSWNSSTTVVPTTGDATSENTQFITYAGDSIQWVGPDQSIRYRLVILETNGKWNNVSKAGSIVYEVDSKGKRGVVTIERLNQIVKVRLMLTTETEPQVVELTVDSIQTF